MDIWYSVEQPSLQYASRPTALGQGLRALALMASGLLCWAFAAHQIVRRFL